MSEVSDVVRTVMDNAPFEFNRSYVPGLASAAIINYEFCHNDVIAIPNQDNTMMIPISRSKPVIKCKRDADKLFVIVRRIMLTGK